MRAVWCEMMEGGSGLIRAELRSTARTREGFGVITLARPDRRNALTPEMLGDIESAVHGLSQARSIAVVGEGSTFCAGFDLTLCKNCPDGGVLRALLGGLSRAILTLRSFPGPVVIGAHGAAIAGGCALLGGADLVVSEPEAKIGYPVVSLGISPAVSAPFLAAAVGPGSARERLLEPVLMNGREAMRIGLVHEIVDKERVALRTISLAEDLASKPTSGIQTTKTWLNELDDAERWAPKARDVSLSLTGGQEERQLLPRVWARETKPTGAE